MGNGFCYTSSANASNKHENPYQPTIMQQSAARIITYPPEQPSCNYTEMISCKCKSSNPPFIEISSRYANKRCGKRTVLRHPCTDIIFEESNVVPQKICSDESNNRSENPAHSRNTFFAANNR